MLAAVMACGCSKKHAATVANPATAGLDVSNKIAAIAAAGDPTTLDALNDWYAEPPAGQNAADFYVRAGQAMTAGDPKSPAFLANNQAALALLLQGAALTSSRYPVDLRDGAMTKLPHLAKTKQAAQLLQSEAVSEARAGNTEAAAKAIVAGVRLSRSLEDEPIIISRLVEVADLALTFAGLEQSLSLHAFTDADLTSIQAALQDADGAASFERVLVGERCFSISHFRMPPEELSKVLSSGNGTPDGPSGPELATYFNSPSYQQDIDFTLDYYSNMLVAVKKPFPASIDAMAEYGQLNVPSDLILSRMLLPALGGLIQRGADSAARIRNARAAIAVERYRLQHQGALPDSLNALVPEFLASVPIDPYDGKPLRYESKPGSGYIIYSVGRNRIDDHGSTRPTGPTVSATLDIVFSVKR